MLEYGGANGMSDDLKILVSFICACLAFVAMAIRCL